MGTIILWESTLPGGASGKQPTYQCRDGGSEGSIPELASPLEEEMATCSSILAWRIPGQRSLEGYNSWGCKESDTTEVTENTHIPDLASLVLVLTLV